MRFQLLGTVSADDQHGLIDLGPAKQRTVLAVLLVNPGAAVSMDQLVDRVWGPAPPQTARRSLQSYLSRLRSVLGTAGGRSVVTRGYVAFSSVVSVGVAVDAFVTGVSPEASAVRWTLDTRRRALTWGGPVFAVALVVFRWVAIEPPTARADAPLR